MSESFSIFVVEDDEFYSEVLEYHLSLNPDVTVTKFTNAKEFLKNLDKNPDAITLDYSLPDMSGEEVLRKIKEYNSEIPVVMVSGQEDIKTAITLLKDGAYDYIVKDEDTKDRIWNAIKNIRENEGLKKEISELKQQVKKKYDFTTSIIGNSPSMKKVFAMIEKAVSSNITVSITGETGTGKEIVAKSIHYNSPRAKKPFLAVNITAIPSELIESELFGHEKGAFTGAVQQRIGRFEEANGGTIFLDEIGELPLPLQAKLLRVINDGTFRRIGSARDLQTDARVLAATNRDLEAQIAQGLFREDLFYRLNVMEVHLPPLRERTEDILPLATYFIGQFSRQKSRFSVTVSAALMNYRWPGNVRELRNAMERAALLSRGEIVLPEHLPARVLAATVAAGAGAPTHDAQRLEQIERDAILKALRKNNFNRTDTAQELAISRRAFTYKLQRLRAEGVSVDS